jgi:predicted restriction endonuclease
LFPRKRTKSFKRPKTLTDVDFLCLCGDKKTYRSKSCFSCLQRERITDYETKTLKELKIDTPQSAFVKVRQHAKRKFKAFGMPYCCKVCGYDTYLELAHIKGIASFPDDTLLGEVNCMSNLAYLCPNHHKELDNGIINLAG